MNEYRSSIEFASPDLPLRDDVRRLGALVGDLLVEQVSAAFLDEVEAPPPVVTGPAAVRPNA